MERYTEVSRPATLIGGDDEIIVRAADGHIFIYSENPNFPEAEAVFEKALKRKLSDDVGIQEFEIICCPGRYKEFLAQIQRDHESLRKFFEKRWAQMAAD